MPKVKKTKSITIKTGDASTYRDRLLNGVLETSTNGKTWTKIADFKRGNATGTLAKGVTQLRIKCTRTKYLDDFTEY